MAELLEMIENLATKEKMGCGTPESDQILKLVAADPMFGIRVGIGTIFNDCPPPCQANVTAKDDTGACQSVCFGCCTSLNCDLETAPDDECFEPFVADATFNVTRLCPFAIVECQDQGQRTVFKDFRKEVCDAAVSGTSAEPAVIALEISPASEASYRLISDNNFGALPAEGLELIQSSFRQASRHVDYSGLTEEQAVASIRSKVVEWVGSESRPANWAVDSNWSGGRVPSANDHVLVAAPGTRIRIGHASPVVRSLNVVGDLAIENGHVRVAESFGVVGSLALGADSSLSVDGSATLKGSISVNGSLGRSEAIFRNSLVLDCGTEISAIGPNALFRGDGPATAKYTRLSAHAGGRLELPKLGAHSNSSCVSRRDFQNSLAWTADGDGSSIELASLTEVTVRLGSQDGPTAPGFVLFALDGGKINLPKVGTVFSDRGVSLAAIGADSVIDLSALARLSAREGTIVSSDGAEIWATALREIAGARVNANSDGLQLSSALEKITNSQIAIDGRTTWDLANVREITGSQIWITNADFAFNSLQIADCAQISVLGDNASFSAPGLTSYTCTQADRSAGFEADAGEIRLPSLRYLDWAGQELRIEASNSGLVDLSGLGTLARRSGQVRLSASGRRSKVDLGTALVPEKSEIVVCEDGGVVIRHPDLSDARCDEIETRGEPQ